MASARCYTVAPAFEQHHGPSLERKELRVVNVAGGEHLFIAFSSFPLHPLFAIEPSIYKTRLGQPSGAIVLYIRLYTQEEDQQQQTSSGINRYNRRKGKWIGGVQGSNGILSSMNIRAVPYL